MNITRRPLGPITDIASAQTAIRDLSRMVDDLLAVVNVTQQESAAGQFKVPFTDENGNTTMLRLVAGAGVTITPNTVTGICTISSP